MNKCGNYEPMPIEEMVRRTGLSLAEIRAFLDKEFGGYDQYVAACNAQQPLDETLDRLIAEGKC